MAPTPARGKRTGPKPSFTQDDVVDCALRQGLATFMLADIARALGVAVPSLYRVIDSRDHIVDLALERVSCEVSLPADELDWEAILWDQVDQLCRLLSRYPGLAQTLITTPGCHVHTQHILRAYRDRLVDAGIPGGKGCAEFAIDLVGDTAIAYVFGVEQYTRPGIGGVRGVDIARDKLARVDDPIFEITDYWFDRRCLDTKIEVILAGIKAQAAAGTPPILDLHDDTTNSNGHTP